MKTLKNTIQSFMLEIREEHDPSTIFCVWLVFAVMLCLIIGLIFLTINFPIIGLCTFLVIFLPIAFICYAKYSDYAIDERLKEISKDSKSHFNFPNF